MESHPTHSTRLRADALRCHADALRNEGKSIEAVEAYRAAIALNPVCAGAHAGLGALLLQLGRLDEAVSVLRDATRADPGSARTICILAEAECRAGRVEEGIGSCERLLDHPDPPAEALYGLAAALRGCGQFERAASLYRRSLRARPGWTEAYLALGRTYSDLGRHAEAIVCFEEAIGRKPSDSDAWRDLGRSLRSHGISAGSRTHLLEAVHAFERAVELDPHRTVFLYELGVACALVRDHAGVRTQYNALLRRDPSFAEALARYLPRARREADQPSAAAPERGSRSARLCFLVVDDDPQVRSLLRTVLSRYYDAQVHVARGEEAAWAVVGRITPDLVTTDLRRPSEDGVALLRRLRSDPRTRAVPVLAITAEVGRAVEGDQAWVFEAVLSKPFEVAALVRRVDSILGIVRGAAG